MARSLTLRSAGVPMNRLTTPLASSPAALSAPPLLDAASMAEFGEVVPEGDLDDDDLT